MTSLDKKLEDSYEVILEEELDEFRASEVAEAIDDYSAEGVGQALCWGKIKYDLPLQIDFNNKGSTLYTVKDYLNKSELQDRIKESAEKIDPDLDKDEALFQDVKGLLEEFESSDELSEHQVNEFIFDEGRKYYNSSIHIPSAAEKIKQKLEESGLIDISREKHL